MKKSISDSRSVQNISEKQNWGSTSTALWGRKQ